MVIVLSVLIGSLALTACVALICFKGITFYKKMEVIPTKEITPIRHEELDEAERKINEMNRINAEQARIRQSATVDETTALPTAPIGMDAVLKNIQDVFGPELPPMPQAATAATAPIGEVVNNG